MKDQDKYTRIHDSRQPTAAAPGVNPYPPRRAPPDNDSVPPKSEPVTTEWQQINGFRVQLVLHHGEDSPERRRFFRQIIAMGDGPVTRGPER